jgi:hypothetical protein
MKDRALQPDGPMAGLLFLVATASLAGLLIAAPLDLSPWQAVLVWIASGWAGFALGLGLMVLGLRWSSPRTPPDINFTTRDCKERDDGHE